jgi:hypothetical protein
MSSIVIAGDTSGSVTLQAPAVAGTTTLTLPSTSGTVVLTGGAGAFTTVTAAGASQTNPVYLGASSGALGAVYSIVSLNNDNTASGMVGMWGNGGTDTSLNLNVPTGKAITLRTNGTNAAIVNANGISIDPTITPSSGVGILFPSTQSASSNANTLDDYEEGTFTPTLGGSVSDPTATYSSQQASYTKIGRVVTVCVNLSPISYSGGSGNLFIKGLPFAVAVFSVGTALTSGVNLSTRTWCVAYSGGSNVTYFRLVGSGSNIGDYDVTTGDVSFTDSITCTLTYYTA